MISATEKTKKLSTKGRYRDTTDKNIESGNKTKSLFIRFIPHLSNLLNNDCPVRVMTSCVY